MENKGTILNPYTEEEFNAMVDAGTWKGGYVQGLGYCMPELIVDGSYISSEISDSDISDSDFLWWSSFSDPSDPQDNENADENPQSGSGTSNNTSSGTATGNNGGSHTGTNTGGANNTSISVSGKIYGISSYTLNILKNLPNYSGNIVITSVARTPKEQAAAMLANIKKTGIQEQIRLYASPGDQVILTYNRNLSDELNINRMTTKIIEVGPSKVSKHCANPSIINVFDVSRSNLSNVSIFINALRLKGAYCIDEPKNNCVHVEIPQ